MPGYNFRMFDNSNIFDLALSVPADSCSLFNTQNPGNPCNKDPLKSNAPGTSDEYLLYYNRQLLSTRHLPYYSRESQQIKKRLPVLTASFFYSGLTYL